jgi:RNA polymerase sigma factor (sigma-70 family)
MGRFGSRKRAAVLPFLQNHRPTVNRQPNRFPQEENRNGSATSRFARVVGAVPGPDADFALPHILQFGGIIGGAWRTYYHGQYDEAMYFSREDALAMRNDAWLMSLIDERKRAVATLKWHVEVDNPRDPIQKALADGLTQLYKNLPRYTDLTMSGLEALWFGRAGDQFDWVYKNVQVPAMPRLASAPGVPASMVASEGEYETRKVLWMRNHEPIEGDKIDYDFDGTPYILVSPIVALNTYQSANAEFRRYHDGRWQRDDQLPPRPMVPDLKAEHASLGFTTIGGKALFLKGNWRSRFRIHKHQCIDSSYWQPWKAGSLYGVGIRSVVFWYWWLRQEYLANITDWCARTGLGIKLWYYEQGNNASKSAILQAAKDQSDKVNIAVPYDPNNPNRPAVDIVEMAGTGADLLSTIVKHVEEYIERYIVGQNMTGGSDDFSAGFGDKGRSELASRTNWQITKLDARKFDDTNTTDILDNIKRFSYPEYAEIPARLVSEVDDPDIKKWSEGAKVFVEMGGEIVEDEAREKLGLSKPRPTDTTIGGAAALQAQQATSGHVKPPGDLAPGGEQANGQANDKPNPLEGAVDTADRLKFSWVTMGGHVDGDKKHVGGFHVEVDENGKIQRGGTPEMHGKPIHEAIGALERVDKDRKKAAEKEKEAEQKPAENPPEINSANLQNKPAAQPEKLTDEQKSQMLADNEDLAIGMAYKKAKQGYGEVDDLAQEANIAMLQAADAWDESKGPFKNFASRAINNRFTDILRAKQRRPQQQMPESFDAEQPRADTRSDDLHAAIAKLPEAERSIIGKLLEGQTVEQIGEALGQHKSTVSRAATKARATLKELLSSQSYAEFEEKLRYADGRSSEYRRSHSKTVEHALERLSEIPEDATDEEVEAVIAAIAKQFTVDELKELAREYGVTGSTKGKLIDGLIEKCVKEKETYESQEEKAYYDECRAALEKYL